MGKLYMSFPMSSSWESFTWLPPWSNYGGILCNIPVSLVSIIRNLWALHEAAKERVTPFLSKSLLVTYFRFCDIQYVSCGLSPAILCVWAVRQREKRMTELHSTKEAGSKTLTKKRCLRKKVCQYLFLIKPPLSKRRHLRAVRCPGIVKSIVLLLQTASVLVCLAILCS